MKLVVGLGNPGKEYEKTRHNIGFMILDFFAQNNQGQFSYKSKFKGEVCQISLSDQTIILLKPTTYMNLSGESVQIVKQFYNIKEEDILVVYDDLDLETGKMRFRQKGSAGGHNGIKSIISCLNSQEFHRLKIGIDKDPRIPTKNYVLGKFNKQETEIMEVTIHSSVDAIKEWINMDILFVMNKYN